jgi:D-amino-acid dehydrogenase
MREGRRGRDETKVLGLVREGDRIGAAQTDKGDLVADAFVVALGSFSPTLVRPLGLRLPVYPVKGYSITAPIIDPTRAPESTLLDESYKIAITRLGDRIRVGAWRKCPGLIAASSRGSVARWSIRCRVCFRTQATLREPAFGRASGR